MTNVNLKNKWLSYPWLFNQGLDYLIHPDDLEKLKGQGIGLVLCTDDSDNEYITIKNKLFTFKAKKSGVNNIYPAPAYLWNQEVKIKSKPFLNCLVNDFFWHHKDERYYYQLTIGDKIDKKRYSEDDLECKIEHNHITLHD